MLYLNADIPLCVAVHHQRVPHVTRSTCYILLQISLCVLQCTINMPHMLRGPHVVSYCRYFSVCFSALSTCPTCQAVHMLYLNADISVSVAVHYQHAPATAAVIPAAGRLWHVPRLATGWQNCQHLPSKFQETVKVPTHALCSCSLRLFGIIWQIYIMIWYDTIRYDRYGTIWYDMIRYDMLWYDMLWYDVIRYDTIRYDMIWYDMVWYDMIYLTTIGLTPGGSSTVHINKQTINRTTQFTN